MDLLQYIGSIGGITGVLAVMIFMGFRKTSENLVRQMREDRTFMEDRLSQVITEYNTSCRESKNTLLEFKGVLSELYTYLKAKNGH